MSTTKARKRPRGHRGRSRPRCATSSTALGEDPDRAGLLKTPERVENSLRWLTRGYDMSVADAVGDAVFEESAPEHDPGARHRALLAVRAPPAAVLRPGARGLHPERQDRRPLQAAADRGVFARRLQVQERLTDQIADAIMDVLQPHGVGVLIEAAHLCMAMRGVEKQNSRTVTSAVRGIFRSDIRTRDEFLRLVHGRASRVTRTGRTAGRGDRCLPRDRTGGGGGARRSGATVVRLARSLGPGRTWPISTICAAIWPGRTRWSRRAPASSAIGGLPRSWCSNAGAFLLAPFEATQPAELDR